MICVLQRAWKSCSGLSTDVDSEIWNICLAEGWIWQMCLNPGLLGMFTGVIYCFYTFFRLSFVSLSLSFSPFSRHWCMSVFRGWYFISGCLSALSTVAATVKIHTDLVYVCVDSSHWFTFIVLQKVLLNSLADCTSEVKLPTRRLIFFCLFLQ